MAEINANLTEEKLSSRTKWTFTAGGIGRDMAYSLFSGFLLTYILLTKNVDGKQFAAISIILVICRIWDAINDPIMGGIIENTRSKWGKFKPWIFLGVITNSIVLVLVFALPITQWAYVIALVFLYLLWDITFTMNDIAYWSMLPALSSNPKERSTLTAMANLFADIGSIVALGLIPIFTAGESTLFGNAVTAYAVIAIVIALVFLGCQMMTVFGAKERAGALIPVEKIGVKKMASIIFKNDQLLWTSLAMLLYNFGGSMILAFGSMYVYFEFSYDGTLVFYLTAAYAIVTVLSNVFYPKTADKLTRRQIQLFSTLLAIFGYLVFFLTGIAWPMNFWILAVSLLFIGYGQQTFYNILTISIQNTVEYNELKTGRRDESLIFAVRPFMAKMGSSLQQLAIMAVYLAVGVTSITKQISEAENQAAQGLITESVKLGNIREILTQVTPQMKEAFRAAIAFIPIVLMIGAYLVLRLKYKIDEKFYDDILKQIEEKKKAKVEN
jgi:sugar (Glycoside-Pentoside-Hexuronide) transporter